MPAQGTVLLDFGAFPGASDASVAVASAGITAGALVEAWILPAQTADHSADEHVVETLRVLAGNVQAGVGFTVYGVNISAVQEPVDFLGHLSRFTGTGAHTGRGRADTGLLSVQSGGAASRLYGKWNIAWVWNA